MLFHIGAELFPIREAATEAAMLPPHPQMYRKNIIQAIKCAHPLFLLLCRGEPTGTLMRNHCSDTCCHLQRTIVHTTPEPCHPICVPSCVRFRSLSPYLRPLARTAPEACRPICVPHAYGSDTSAHCSALYTSFYASYRSSLHTFLIIYLYLLYKSFKGFI